MTDRDDVDEGGGSDQSPDAAGQAAPDTDRGPIPTIQRLYESIWLWAFLAILFWAISYLGWGYFDLISIEAG